ncbi:MAG: YopX family protein [Candidatus Ornithomonoglobus sp.]
MREHLFRGKHKKGFWCYGNLIVNTNGTAIITPDETIIGKYGAVIPETVGEYTGKNDKNGRKIFEHDIVKYTFNPSDGYRTGVVEHSPCCFIIKGDPCALCVCEECDAEVVGNIHDNPELLEV